MKSDSEVALHVTLAICCGGRLPQKVSGTKLRFFRFPREPSVWFLSSEAHRDTNCSSVLQSQRELTPKWSSRLPSQTREASVRQVPMGVGTADNRHYSLLLKSSAVSAGSSVIHLFCSRLASINSTHHVLTAGRSLAPCPDS